MTTELFIVEDTEKRRTKVIEKAREAGFEVITVATTEEEAHDWIGRRIFQVAVVDLGLPNGKEGLDVIQHLHQAQPLCRIIAVTAQYEDVDGVEALQRGAHDFISSKWEYVNFFELLCKRLRMWRGLVESVPANEPAGV